MRLLCSTGTFSRHPDFTDYRSILKYGPDLPVDGLEVLFYESWYSSADLIACHLAASGLRLPVVHGEKSINVGPGREGARELDTAFDRLRSNCRLAQAIGANVLVFHLWG